MYLIPLVKKTIYCYNILKKLFLYMHFPIFFNLWLNWKNEMNYYLYCETAYSIINILSISFLKQNWRIQTSIKPNILSYLMENLLVVNLDWKFKPTKHKYTLSFVKATKLTQLDTDSIPKVYFDFVTFADIL